MKHYSKELEDFILFLNECEADLKNAREVETLMDRQTQDILHHIELEESSHYDYICEGVSLKDIRNRRRVAKNEEKVLTPMVEWVCANRKTIDSLRQVLGKIRKEERAAAQRFYVNRTDVIEKILKDNDEGGDAE